MNHNHSTVETLGRQYKDIEVPKQPLDRALLQVARPVKSPFHMLGFSLRKFSLIGVPALMLIIVGGVGGYRAYTTYRFNTLTSVTLPAVVTEDAEVDDALNATSADTVSDSDLLS